MDEARSFRRAFAAGLLTLGVAVSGQRATSQAVLERMPAVRTACSIRAFNVPAPYAHAEEPSRSLVQRVARAVIGAMLDGFV